MKAVWNLFKKNAIIQMEVDRKTGFSNKFMAKFFIFSGIWKSETNHQDNFIIAFINLTILTVALLSISYMFVLKYDDIDVNTEILLHLAEIFFTTCVQLLLIVRKQHIARVAEAISIPLDDIIFPIRDRERCLGVVRREQKLMKKVIKLAVFGIISVYLSVIFDSFVISKQNKLLYPSWFPFNTDSDHRWLYYMAIVFELVVYVELLFIDMAAAGLWYGTINMVSAFLEILGLGFHTVFQEDREVNINENNITFREKVKMCVDLHNFIRGLIKDLKSSMGEMFLALVLSSQVAIVFCGFHVIQALKTINQGNEEYMRLFKFFCGLLVFTLVLFVYCASGQKLSDKCENLHNSLYQCHWDRLPISNRKCLYICQTMTKHPLVIQMIFPANLYTFKNSIRMVFNYVNYLLAMKEKKS